jgi:RimJ/RimL family protein N-acetyltransferase
VDVTIDGPETSDRLRVVPMGPELAAALADFHEHLSATTIRNRYFNAHPHLSTAELTWLCGVDHHDRDAITIVDDDDAIVAVGRLDRLAPDSPTAEVAFVVADRWQRHGLGGQLLRLLVIRARELGITRLEADTLTTNTTMQAVFRHCGRPVTFGVDHGVVHVTIAVAPSD